MVLNKYILLISFGMSLTLFASIEQKDFAFADDMMRLTGFDKCAKESINVQWSFPKEITVDGKVYRYSHKDKSTFVFVCELSGESIRFRLNVEFGNSIYDLLYKYCLSNARSSLPGTVEDKAKFPMKLINDQMVVVYSRRGNAAQLFYNNMKINVYQSNYDAFLIANALLEAGLVK